MNAKQRRAHVRELTDLYKSTVPAEFNAELVSELITAGKDAKRQEDAIESLRAQVAELKRQLDLANKRCALLGISK